MVTAPLSEFGSNGPMRETVSVRLARPKQYVSMLRSYKVFLDGQPLCKLRNGDEKEVEVAIGKHTASARIDWCRTREIEVDCGGEKAVVIRVFSPLSRWKILLIPFAILIPKAWIGIEVVNE